MSRHAILINVSRKRARSDEPEPIFVLGDFEIYFKFATTMSAFIISPSLRGAWLRWAPSTTSVQGSNLELSPTQQAPLGRTTLLFTGSKIKIM